MEINQLLRKLTSYPCVAGDEQELTAVLAELLSPYGEVTSDALGNVFCTFGSGRHFLLDAHIDEIGFTVTSVTDGGFLKLSNCGGVDKRLLLGSEVTVYGNEKLNGIISTLPPHLQKNGDEKKIPEITDISVDVGLTKEQACRAVPLGSRVTFRHRFDALLGKYVASNCLDDRAGVASILLALDELKRLPAKISVMFSTQEEVGTRGAKTGPFGKNIDEAVAVDVSFGYTPNCSKEECGTLGKGVMIGISPVLDKEISRDFIACAEADNIDYQLEVMNGKTGTNADVINLSEGGKKCGLLSIPLRYMHTPVEVVNTDDILSVSRLIVSYIGRKAGAVDA